MVAINYTELDWREAILLGVALRDGLIETVADEPRCAADVAGTLSMDGRAVHVVLSALSELGLLDRSDDGKFHLLEEHRSPLLEREHEDYVGASVVHRCELIGSWSQLGDVLRSGEPVEDRTAPGFGGTAEFIGAMRRGARAGAASVAEAVLPRLPDGAYILDVGGGPGTNAEAFVQGGARVTVFDRPEVISMMHERLSQSGVETAVGDMNESLPQGPYDAIYFGNTSHMYGPEENQALFEKMRGSLAPGGLLVIREFLRGASEDAALFAVNMLVTTARGNTYTTREYEEWLLGAGFEEAEVVPVPRRGTHLIFARKPA